MVWLKSPALANYITLRHHIALDIPEQASNMRLLPQLSEFLAESDGEMVNLQNEIFYKSESVIEESIIVYGEARAVPKINTPIISSVQSTASITAATPSNEPIIIRNASVQKQPLKMPATLPAIVAAGIDTPASKEKEPEVIKNRNEQTTKIASIAQVLDTAKTFDPTTSGNKPIELTDIKTERQETVNPSTTTQTSPSSKGEYPIESISINSSDKVLFCGDSLMEDLAPVMATRLKSQKVAFKNLGRHSTGLTVPRYFDWPKTIRAEIEANNATLLIIFLGANDALDILDKGKAVYFNSITWREVYSQRVESIAEMAENAGVKIIWVTLPPMDNAYLAKKAPILNTIYQDIALRHSNILLIPSDAVLTEDGNTFIRYKQNSAGITQRLRADDGIHLGPSGNRLLSELIWKHVEFL